METFYQGHGILTVLIVLPLLGALAAEAGLAGWWTGRTRRVASGFYISQAVELVAP